MIQARKVAYGGLLEDNSPPLDIPNASVRINGEHKGTRKPFSVSDEILSKHLLLVGGTGSGKTNVFYHFVSQLKKKLSRDDVMLIFDSKGDFHKKFFADGDNGELL